jgi:hypothetical protein
MGKEGVQLMQAALASNNRFEPLRASVVASYLSLPGVASNYASTPDSVTNSLTGDIDIRLQLALDDWTPAVVPAIAAKWAGELSWLFRVQTNGDLLYASSADGSGVPVNVESSAPVGFADGATGWVRVTHDVDNGSAGNDVKFWTSADGDTWVQLGVTRTTAGVTAIFNSNAPLSVGASGDGSIPTGGKVYRFQLYNGIGGTLAADFNPALSLKRQTSLRGATGELWTINGSTASVL